MALSERLFPHTTVNVSRGLWKTGMLILMVLMAGNREGWTLVNDAAQARATMFVNVVSLVLFLGAVTCASQATPREHEFVVHEQRLNELFDHGDAKSVVKYASRVIEGLPLAERNQSRMCAIYKYLGAGFYALGDLEEAKKAFLHAAAVPGDDLHSWLLLGDTLLHQSRPDDAALVYEEAILRRRLTDDISRLLRARSWMADWRNREDLEDAVKAFVLGNMRAGRAPGVGMGDYTGLPAEAVKAICRHQPNAQAPARDIRRYDGGVQLDTLRKHATHAEGGVAKEMPRHRLGFVTSDLGVHPVSSLIRGFLTELDRTRFEVHVYCMSKTDSWWRRNITAGVEHFHSLYGMSHEQSAGLIYQHGIHTLLELNGHTMHSGLPILALRPAPVQISFLGSPLTTGTPFIDFVLSDALATPPTQAYHFTEKLLLGPASYIVNDYAQTMGHVVTRGRREQQHQQITTATDSRVAHRRRSRSSGALKLACFSSFQKLDPGTFSVWSNVMRRVPSSDLSILEYRVHELVSSNLRSEAAAWGVAPSRIGTQPQVPWIDHVWAKSKYDIMLDTLAKNGHTTSLDALWAGVPVVTTHGGRMDGRAGLSLYGALGDEFVDLLVAPSIKAYEDIAVRLGRNRGELAAVREEVERRRTTARLFNTRSWTRAAEAALMAAVEVKAAVGEAWHLWVAIRPGADTPIQLRTASDTAESRVLDNRECHNPPHEKEAHRQQAEQVEVNSPVFVPKLLHIGGRVRHKDWEIVDIEARPEVDHVTSMDNLSAIANSTVAGIYASHCLEHAAYGQHDPGVLRTLREWHRVLVNGGLALIAVPDLRTLALMFTNATLTPQQRFSVMRMMYGGQVDGHDYHRVGFDQDILTAFLSQAGFCEVRKVDRFGLFNDSSGLTLYGRNVSLNVRAAACKSSEEPKVSVRLGSLSDRGGVRYV